FASRRTEEAIRVRGGTAIGRVDESTGDVRREPHWQLAAISRRVALARARLGRRRQTERYDAALVLDALEGRLAVVRGLTGFGEQPAVRSGRCLASAVTDARVPAARAGGKAHVSQTHEATLAIERARARLTEAARSAPVVQVVGRAAARGEEGDRGRGSGETEEQSSREAHWQLSFQVKQVPRSYLGGGFVGGGGLGGSLSIWMHDARSKKKNANVFSAALKSLVQPAGYLESTESIVLTWASRCTAFPHCVATGCPTGLLTVMKRGWAALSAPRPHTCAVVMFAASTLSKTTSSVV